MGSIGFIIGNILCTDFSGGGLEVTTKVLVGVLTFTSGMMLADSGALGRWIVRVVLASSRRLVK